MENEQNAGWLALAEHHHQAAHAQQHAHAPSAISLIHLLSKRLYSSMRADDRG